MGPFKRYRDIALVIVLLAMPFFFLRANIRRPEETSFVDRTLLTLSAPIEYTFSALARGVSSLLGEYVYLVDVKRDNNKLAYQNSRLQAKVSQLSSIEAEPNSTGCEPLAVKVITRSPADRQTGWSPKASSSVLFAVEAIPRVELTRTST